MRTIPFTHLLLAAALVLTLTAPAWVYRRTLFEAFGSDGHSLEVPALPKGMQIRDKVAVITDTFFTPRLVPLMLYYHQVLGPSWPILFYTSQETYDQHFSPKLSPSSSSAAWRRAVADGVIEPRIIDAKFDMITREGVNKYWANSWIWEQLAPAKHVLQFQTDAILCANAHQTVDDFLQYDFIGAPLDETRQIYNGGLSIRNREMTLEILAERDWWTDYNTQDTEYGNHGEDVWMAIWMRKRGANLPSIEEALKFARQMPWNMERPGQPLGYHRLVREHVQQISEIRKWCPEIRLTAEGRLGGHVQQDTPASRV